MNWTSRWQETPASIYMHGPRGNGKTCLGASWRNIVDAHDHAATFRERNEELRIGLLSAQEAAAAIHVPLAETIPDLRFEQPESSEVVADSGHYPFFVQLWGRAIARTLDAGTDTTVTKRVVADARRSVDQQRSAFYQRRLGELAHSTERVGSSLRELLASGIACAHHFG